MKSRFAALTLLALMLAGLAACGEDGAGGPVPTGAEPEEAADGGPVQTPRALLGRLHHRLVTGEGLHDRVWQEDVRRVAEVLWPPDEEGAVPEAGRVHVQLAGIAGSTARYVVGRDAEGAAYLEDNPEDLVVHDAFLAAVVTGPARYQAWCEAEGHEVLATWKRTRRARVLQR